MITIAGEALIDLIVDQDGHVDARPGGGPFNVARAVARIGQSAAFLGRLSADRFGQSLRADLERDGVRIAIPESVAAPTTLAVVEIDPTGVPRYRFYLTGTSAAVLQPDLAVAALPADTTALHIGSLGLIMQPIATSLEQLLAALPAGIMVMLDPNCRPAVSPERDDYLDRIGRILRRVDVIKTSAEDLAYLFPDSTAAQAAAVLMSAGPACVIVTDGPRPVRAFLAGAEIIADVPAVRIVDTVGAGDAFGGAFLAWWTGNGMVSADLQRQSSVQSAISAAIEVAVLTCTHRGAEPAWADELIGHQGWAWLPGADRAGRL
jgi:fructokinase